MGKAIEYTSKWKHDYKKVSKLPKFISKKVELVECINNLVAGKALDAKYKDHKLASNSSLEGYRNFHLAPNICVVYKLTADNLLMCRIGSHQDLQLTEDIIY